MIEPESYTIHESLDKNWTSYVYGEIVKNKSTEKSTLSALYVLTQNPVYQKR